MRSTYEGPTGIVGVLHDSCARAGLVSASLWAATPHYISAAPNPQAALALLERLAEMAGTPAGSAELERAASEYQLRVASAIADDPDVAGYVEQLEQAADRDDPPTRRGARRRFRALPARAVRRGGRLSVADATDQTFETDVIERSRELPVVVDFWAEWCGPCRQLGPVLEQAVEATGGAVELVKVDVDANPHVAARYRVQGIPAVKAFRDGRLVDEFTGAVPRVAVDSLSARLLPSEADRLAALGDEASVRRALELQPNHPARAGRRSSGSSRPGDPVLAPALAALEAGETERGLELLLGLLPDAGAELRDRIRQVMVGVFTELGQDDPLAARYRRRRLRALRGTGLSPFDGDCPRSQPAARSRRSRRARRAATGRRPCGSRPYAPSRSSQWRRRGRRGPRRCARRA